MKEDKSKNNFLYPYVQTDEVAENIDEFIIPECQEACKSFWTKNIFTYMCSNRDDGDNKYVLLSRLSPENKAIFEKLKKEDPEHYFYSDYREAYGIRARGDGEEVSKELEKLTEKFKMQDVLEGYYTVENFLIQHFDLSKTVPNPDYVEDLEMPDMDDFDSVEDFLRASREYTKRFVEPETIEVFDETKMTKSAEEYIAETEYKDLYDPERKVVYFSEFYKRGHLRYLEYLKRTRQEQSLDDDGIR